MKLVKFLSIFLTQANIFAPFSENISKISFPIPLLHPVIIADLFLTAFLQNHLQKIFLKLMPV